MQPQALKDLSDRWDAARLKASGAIDRLVDLMDGGATVEALDRQRRRVRTLQDAADKCGRAWRAEWARLGKPV